MATPSAIVERIFAELAEGGEFARLPRDVAYVVRGPIANPTCARVYMTKPSVAAALDRGGLSDRIATVRRYGLPDDRDLAWLQQLVGPRHIWFLGDLDPPDLLVYAWLRDRLQPAAVRHLGINDALLERAGFTIQDSSTIDCSAEERRAIPVLKEAIADLPDLIGPNCFELLSHGRKLELEALVGAQPGRLAEILLQLPRA